MPDDPFGPQARQEHLNRVRAEFHKLFAGDLRDIDDEIRSRGWAGAGDHPNLSAAIKRMSTVSEGMQDFDRRVAEHRLRQAAVQGVEGIENPFNQAAEVSITDFLEGQPDSLVRNIKAHSKRLVAANGENHWRRVVQQTVDKLVAQTRQWYAEKRADFDLELQLLPDGQNPGTAKRRRRRKREPSEADKKKWADEDALVDEWNTTKAKLGADAYLPDFAKRHKDCLDRLVKGTGTAAAKFIKVQKRVAGRKRRAEQKHTRAAR